MYNDSDGVNWHTDIQKMIPKQYKKESLLTKNYVIVHAIMDALYAYLGTVDEVINDIQNCKNFPDYARA